MISAFDADAASHSLVPEDQDLEEEAQQHLEVFLVALSLEHAAPEILVVA